MTDSASMAAPTFRPAGTGGIHTVLGMTHVNKATTAETDGAFLLMELTVPPGCGAPMHRHDEDAECFYILEGRLTFAGPDGSRAAGPGDCCLLPAGGDHAFVNDGESSVRALVVVSPGRKSEAFFGTLDAAARAGGPDLAAVPGIAARHGLTIRPPAA